MHRPRIAPLALSLLLLASCGSPPAQSGGEDCQEQEAWSAGYAAGYEDGCHEGMSARPGSGEAGQPEDPEPAPSEPDPSGFVMLSDAVPDAVLEIRYHSAYNFVGERIDGYEAPAALLTREAAEALLAPLVSQVCAVLGDVVYGVDVESLEAVASGLLRRKGLTLSAAESCTGGLIAKRITGLPGASAIFRGGVVSYTNAVKANVLGVPEELLEKYGAVSEPVARSMAECCRRLCGSDLAVSVTGVAGPDRDDRGNEIGTVYIALASEEETICRKLSCGKGRGRDRVRSAAASHVFDLLRRYLSGLPL